MALLPFFNYSMAWVRRKNVYFGKDSVAKIITKEGKPDYVDTADDVLAVIYAFVLDIVTPPRGYLLSHYETKTGNAIGVELADPRTIHGRFYVLRRLVFKFFPKQAGIIKLLDTLEQLAMKKKYHELEALIQELAKRTNTLDLYNYVKAKILEAKAKKKYLVRD